MSSLAEEYDLYDLNKKERIVYLAKKDPFLKVEKLAQLVETTPHYVRTVLSEASLSLTKLRKEYAKVVRNQTDNSSLLLDVLNIEQFGKLKLALQNLIVINNSDRYDTIIQKGDFCLERSILFEAKETPIMLNTTFFADSKEIKDFYQLKNMDNITFSEPKIRTELSHSILSDLLNIDEGGLVLVLEKEISVAKELKGLDLVYLIPDRIELSLNGSCNQVEVIRC